MTTYRRPRPGTLEKATITAAGAAEWIETTDKGAVWLLRDVMAALDGYRRQTSLGGVPAIPPRELAELANVALRLLRDLGLTPTARHRLGLWESEIDDAFAQIVRLAAPTVGDDTE